MKALVRATCLALVIVGAAPAVAQAAETFYAQGGGGNGTAPCSQAEPCNLGKAILKANEAGTGSAVVLLPGPDFTPGEHLEVAGAIDIGGVPGQSRPTIRGAKNVEALVVRNGAHLHDANVIGANQLGFGSFLGTGFTIGGGAS